VGVEYRLGACGLRGERGEGRNIVVAFDQRRHRSAARDGASIERPHGLGDRRAVGVDQEPRVFVVAVFSKPGQMDLADPIEREGVDIGHRLEAVINGGDIDILESASFFVLNATRRPAYHACFEGQHEFRESIAF
jgi:hypothetical protein